MLIYIYIFKQAGTAKIIYDQQYIHRINPARVAAGTRYLSLLQLFQTEREVHTAACSVDVRKGGRLFLWAKRLGRQFHTLPHLVSRLRKNRAIRLLHHYAFIVITEISLPLHILTVNIL